MRTGKNDSTSTRAGHLVVVETKTDSIEREVDSYVKSIRTLISKLHPSERQKYYNGLLAFILNEQIELSNDANTEAIEASDYSQLSQAELNLLEELSIKMQQLYRTIGPDVH